MVLSPQPPRRSPLGSGDTEPESERTEGDHRRDREDEVLAWALQPGKKLGVGWGSLLSCAKWRIQKYSAFISIKFASNLHETHLIAETSTLLALESNVCPPSQPVPSPRRQSVPAPHPWPLASPGSRTSP